MLYAAIDGNGDSRVHLGSSRIAEHFVRANIFLHGRLIQRCHLVRSIYQESDAGDNTPRMTEDLSLLAQVQRGDESAMGQIYDRYSRLVYSVALRVLRDSAAAEDVLQEIFMQIWRSPDSFLATRGSLGGWLAVVARNRSIDVIRRRRVMTPVEDVALVSRTNLADEAERNWLTAKARSIIQTLSVEQRRTIEMAFFDGLTHTEIAEMTGEPLGTVKTRIRAALIAVRKGMMA